MKTLILLMTTLTLALSACSKTDENKKKSGLADQNNAEDITDYTPCNSYNPNIQIEGKWQRITQTPDGAATFVMNLWIQKFQTQVATTCDFGGTLLTTQVTVPSRHSPISYEVLNRS